MQQHLPTADAEQKGLVLTEMGFVNLGLNNEEKTHFTLSGWYNFIETTVVNKSREKQSRNENLRENRKNWTVRI